MRMPVIAAMLTLAACVSAPPPHCPKPDNTAECLTFQQIDVSCKDVLTDSTAKQIVTHNKAGKAACGWVAKPCR